MVVPGHGFVVGNISIFHLQSLGLALTAFERCSYGNSRPRLSVKRSWTVSPSQVLSFRAREGARGTCCPPAAPQLIVGTAASAVQRVKRAPRLTRAPVMLCEVGSSKGRSCAAEASLPDPHCNFAYSTLASFRIGISESASFQITKKSL